MKRFFSFIILTIIMTILVVGCGGQTEDTSIKDQDNQTQEPVQEEVDVQTETSVSESAIPLLSQENSENAGTIQEFYDEFNAIQSIHEEAINSLDYPIIELATFGLEFAFAPMYEILNMENKNGTFEGELILSGDKGYITKTNDIIEFGKDYIREEPGISPNDKVGDEVVEKGAYQADKGYIEIENSTSRADSPIYKCNFKLQRTKDGGFVGLRQSGSNFDLRGNDSRRNDVLFLITSENKYEFVLANGDTGANYELVDLKDYSLEQAKDVITQAGFKIDMTGEIKNGVLNVENY